MHANDKSLGANDIAKYRNGYNNSSTISRSKYRLKQNIVQISPIYRDYRDIRQLSFALLVQVRVEEVRRRGWNSSRLLLGGIYKLKPSRDYNSQAEK